jgi:hypothetical protein
MAKNQIGAIIAAIALVLAILIGLLEATGITSFTNYNTAIVITLAVAGILVGIFNIKNSESVPFLVSVLVLAGGVTALAVIPVLGAWLQVIFARLAQILIPAAIVVATTVAWKKMAR